MLRERMLESREYDEAMRRFLAKPGVRFDRSAGRYPERDELHGRKRLR